MDANFYQNWIAHEKTLIKRLYDLNKPDDLIITHELEWRHISLAYAEKCLKEIYNNQNTVKS